MMAILINTLTNCSLTDYSLRKEIFKEEIKQELQEVRKFPSGFFRK